VTITLTFYSPREVSHFTAGGHVNDVFLDSKLAYMTSVESGLYILDFTDPSRPREVSHFNTSGIRDVIVYDNHAYITCIHSGLYILDITDPSLPRQISHVNDIGEVESISIRD